MIQIPQAGHDSILTQLGVAGIFMVLVLQMLFKFLDKREEREALKSHPGQNGGGAGAQSTDYWRGFFEGAMRNDGDKTRELISDEASATRAVVHGNRDHILGAVQSENEKTREAVLALHKDFNLHQGEMKCRRD